MTQDSNRVTSTKMCENVSNYVESEEDATIPKINLDDVNNDFITENDDYEEIIYGGHESSGKLHPGPRVTEVIQQDGQMTIEMEVDSEYFLGVERISKSFDMSQKMYRFCQQRMFSFRPMCISLNLLQLMTCVEDTVWVVLRLIWNS